MLKQYDELVQEVLEDIFVITKSEDNMDKIVYEIFINGDYMV